MAPHEGILDSGAWSDVDVKEKEWDVDTEAAAAWQPKWKPWRSKAALPSRTSKRDLVRRAGSWFWPGATVDATPPEKLRKTAWLDGLRGFAAFLVYWQHHELWAHDSGYDAEWDNWRFENGFGYSGHYHFVALPGIRTFFTGGHFAVSTFFVISGYVLSNKPLSLIQSGQYDKLSENVASALFRRWLRLWIPLIVTTFLYMCSWHAFGLWISYAEPQGSWREEVWAWYCEMKNFSFVFKEGGEPWLSYNYHLWSIPVEFRGSIVVYTFLMAFSRCSKQARLLGEVALVWYFMYVADGWYCAMFMAGVLLSDLDLLAAKNELPRFLARLEPAKTFIYYHLLVIALYLGGVPSHDRNVQLLRENRGWYYLSFLKPQAVFDYKWFYLFWAAVLLVASVPRIRWLKGFFETRFCQYLGRISFALYLVHGPVLWTIGDRIYTAVGWEKEKQVLALAKWVGKFPLPTTGPLGLEPAFLLPHIVLLPVTLWLAEIVTRTVDTPSVKFGQWLYGKALAGDTPSRSPSPGKTAGERLA